MSPRPEQFVFMLMSSRLLRAPLKNAKKKCLFSAGYLLANKNEKSEDYSKAVLIQRVLFFITIFRLAIPAVFRFTDVTELM